MLAFKECQKDVSKKSYPGPGSWRRAFLVSLWDLSSHATTASEFINSAPSTRPLP